MDSSGKLDEVVTKLNHFLNDKEKSMLEIKVTIPDEVVEQISNTVAEKVKTVINKEFTNYPTNEGLLDVPGLAKYLSVSADWVRTQIRRKSLPSVRLGGNIRFNKKVVDKWIQACSVPAVKEVAEESLRKLRR